MLMNFDPADGSSNRNSSMLMVHESVQDNKLQMRRSGLAMIGGHGVAQVK